MPLKSLGLAFCAGLLFLLPLPSWRLLVSYISSIGILAYGVGPVVLFCFRQTLPEQNFIRPFRLAMAWFVAPMAFIVSNLLVFWAGAAVAGHLLGGLFAAFFLYCGWQWRQHGTLAHLAWRGAAWMLPHFGGLWLITWAGPLHGFGLLNNADGAAIIALFSLAILALARRCALPDPEAAKARFGHAA